MWKAISLAVGMTLILIGVELFFVQELEVRGLRGASNPAQQTAINNPFQPASFSTQNGVANGINGPAAGPNTKLVRPRDWMPWSLLAVGTIVMIYTFTLPGRGRSNS